ncbi:fibronectin-binding domain-containing protein [bacterium]|nr:MAG: fibronectin-binding domain-containing protein [bacterium]
MNPYLLKNVIDELNALFIGAIVSKVHQPDERTIVLKLFNGAKGAYLLISTHPQFSSLHITEDDFENPQTPKRFCAYLRSRITNGRVTAFRVLTGQRIALIELKKRIDGTEDVFTLVAELTGKSANIILVDSVDGSGVVLDSLRYFKPDESLRPVMPGLTFTPLPMTSLSSVGELPDKDPAISWNGFASALYSGALHIETDGAFKRRLGRVLSDTKKRLNRKAANLNADKIKAVEEAGYARFGDMLIRNLSQMKKGGKEVSLDDWTKAPPEKVKITLDPKYSPRENAERYFKMAKKAKTALEIISSRSAETEREIGYVDELTYEWETVGSRDDLKELEATLINEGYMKRATPALSKNRGVTGDKRAEPVRRLASSEGFELLCGKSGVGNDLIVRRLAVPEDIWLHAHGVPGSHVLIKTAGRAKQMTMKTITESAAVAAYYSQARGANKVEVIYTEARNVKKPKGARPGMVIVSEYKTLVVKPCKGADD